MGIFECVLLSTNIAIGNQAYLVASVLQSANTNTTSATLNKPYMPKQKPSLSVSKHAAQLPRHTSLHIPRTTLQPTSTRTLHPTHTRHTARAAQSLHLRRVGPARRTALRSNAGVHRHVVDTLVLNRRASWVGARACVGDIWTAVQLGVRCVGRLLHTHLRHLRHLALSHHLCVVVLTLITSVRGGCLCALLLLSVVPVRIAVSAVRDVGIALVNLLVLIVGLHVGGRCRRCGSVDTRCGIHGVLAYLSGRLGLVLELLGREIGQLSRAWRRVLLTSRGPALRVKPRLKCKVNSQQTQMRRPHNNHDRLFQWPLATVISQSLKQIIKAFLRHTCARLNPWLSRLTCNVWRKPMPKGAKDNTPTSNTRCKTVTAWLAQEAVVV